MLCRILRIGPEWAEVLVVVFIVMTADGVGFFCAPRFTCALCA